MADDKSQDELEQQRLAEEEAARKARGDAIEDEDLEQEEAAKKAAEEAEAAKKAAEEAEAAEKAKRGDAIDDDEDEDDDDKSKNKGKGKKILIPKERFDEAVHKERAKREAAQRRIDELEATLGKRNEDFKLTEATAALTKLEDDYEAAILEGEKEKARELRAKASALRENITEYKAIKAADKARSTAVNTVRYETTLERLEADYPIINEDSDEYDEDVASEVLELTQAFVARGDAAHIALNKAAKYALAEYKKGKIQDKEPPKKEDKPDTRTDEQVAEELRAKRDKEAREKAAKAAKATPPNAKDSASAPKDRDDGLPDVTKLSFTAFSKLDDETKAKLRGDYL